jgi:hypothetical protein
MNRKAQIGVISVVFGLIVFIVLWALFFGAWVNTWAQQMITANSLTGVEAFLMANMNLWIGIGVMFGAVGALYFGGGR